MRIEKEEVKLQLSSDNTIVYTEKLEEKKILQKNY